MSCVSCEPAGLSASQGRAGTWAGSFLILIQLPDQQCRGVGRDESVHCTDEVGLPRITQLMMWVSGQRGWGPAGGWRCGDPHSRLVPQFCGTIVLIFFLELAVAVLAFLFQDWVRDRFREFFESNIRSYRDDIDLQNLIDSLQKAVSTCGGAPIEGCVLLGSQASGDVGCGVPGGATSAAGPFSFASSWLPGGPGFLFMCPPPIWIGQGSLAVPVATSPRSPGLSSPGHAGSAVL